MSETSTAQAVQKPVLPDDRDRRLVARFREGDQSAFEEIVSTHERRLAVLVYRMLGSRVDVEDVVQEVFIAVLANLMRFRGQSKFSTWLASIAVNKCRSHQRRRLQWLRARPRLVEQQREANRNRQRKDSPDNYDAVHEAVRRLRRKLREPILLRYFEQMPVPEIADVLGLSTGTVEVRLSRARKKLKDSLQCDRNEE